MDTFDFVIIGAGPAGEAAAHKARALGATSAVIDRRWFGGSCPHIGCIPSKSLLHSADRHAAGADYSWSRASERRDYMVNRAADAAEPDDTSHVKSLESDGSVTYRGEGRITARGRVAVTHDDVTHELAARNIVVAVGSRSKVPPVEGLAETRPWTNRDATLTRELPAQPARARRRPDRLRARPGLRAVRRPNDDRPVGATARAHGPSPQRRGRPVRARA